MNKDKEMPDNRRARVIQILLEKVRHNLDVLFDFDLSSKEFKENYGVTKDELKEVI